MEERKTAAQAAEHTWLGGAEQAAATRAQIADIVAARKKERDAERWKQSGSARRIVRARRPASAMK